ncbi:MAG: hypothetical protein K6F84_04445 [Lachnospiraceae bacterium]|nr:hypothetical protein [Lachnospiraceae bacterium]
MIKLTNQKTLDEALSLFQKKKNKTHGKNAKGYFTIKEYSERLDECFGMSGYEITFPDVKTEILPNGQVYTITKAVITIFDENRNPVFHLEGWGSSEVVYSNDNEKFILLNTLGTVGCTYAIKSACQTVGVFGSRLMAEDDNKSVTASGSSPKAKNVETKAFYITDPAVVVRTESDGLPVYKLMGKEIVGNQCKACSSEILAYPNNYKNCKDKMNKLVSWAMSEDVKKGSKITINVSAVAGNNDAYVFKSFVG